LVADDVVPADLVGVRPVRLVPRRVGAVVHRRSRADQEGVEPVRLLLLAPLREADQLVVRVDRVGALAGGVLQAGLGGAYRGGWWGWGGGGEPYHHNLSFLI